MALSPDQIDRFHADGYLIVEDLLTSDEIETLRQRALAAASGSLAHVAGERRQVEPQVAAGQAVAETYTNSLRKMSHLAFDDEVFLDHARNPKILAIVVELIGPDVKLYQDQLFMKPPRVGSRQHYHQDQPLGFTIEPPEPMVTCWCAIDDATIENGCLWMVPGTHRLGPLSKEQREHYERQAQAGKLGEEQPVELRSGSVSFHHGLTLHSSRENRSDKTRWGYATHYVSAQCAYTGPPEKHDAILVHGQAYPGKI